MTLFVFRMWFHFYIFTNYIFHFCNNLVSVHLSKKFSVNIRCYQSEKYLILVNYFNSAFPFPYQLSPFTYFPISILFYDSAPLKFLFLLAKLGDPSQTILNSLCALSAQWWVLLPFFHVFPFNFAALKLWNFTPFFSVILIFPGLKVSVPFFRLSAYL